MLSRGATSTDCEGAIGRGWLFSEPADAWERVAMRAGTEVAASEREEQGDHARWFERGWGVPGGKTARSLTHARPCLRTPASGVSTNRQISKLFRTWFFAEMGSLRQTFCIWYRKVAKTMGNLDPVLGLKLKNFNKIVKKISCR